MTRSISTTLILLFALLMLTGTLPLAAQEASQGTTGAATLQETPALPADAVTNPDGRLPADSELTAAPQDSQGTTDSAQTTQDTKTQPPAQKEPAADKKQPAAPADDFNRFKTLIIPYAWFATTSTDLKVGDRTFNSVVTPGQASKYLDAAIAARLEASQGHFGGFIDVNSLRLSDTVTPNYRNVTMSFSSGINNYGLFYRFKGSPVFDIYAGARTYSFGTDVKINPGAVLNGRTISRSRDWSDFIIGARMNAPLSKNLGIIVSGDVGGLSSGTNSWQVEGLIDWKLSSSFSLQGGYRSLYFENAWSNPNIDSLSVKSNMYGPVLKLQFGF